MRHERSHVQLTATEKVSVQQTVGDHVVLTFAGFFAGLLTLKACHCLFFHNLLRGYVAETAVVFF